MLNPKATYLVNTYCFIFRVLPFEVKFTQSCPTLATPWTVAPGSSVHGILQARILEWVAISFSRGHSQPRIEPESPALQADSLPTEL